MSQVILARNALAARVRSNRVVALVAIMCLLITGFLWFTGRRPQRYSLSLTAGDPLTYRHELAQVLADEAARHGVDITLRPTSGSKEALAQVTEGKLDVALVQGDLDVVDPELAQIAVLHSEVLHLFVKPGLVNGGLEALRGKRLNLSTRGSGTRKVATETLLFIGLRAGVDFQDEERSYAELMKLPPNELPDGIFAVSALPWTLGAELIRHHGYRLMELPFGEALSLRDSALHDMQIPPYSYSVVPPVPERPVHTVGMRLLVVGNRRIPEAAVRQLLEVVFESDFSRRANLPPLSAAATDTAREFPLHPGTVQYLHRNEPLVTGEVLESAENLRSFLVSAAVAGFLLWRWQVRRRMIGFETYIDGVTEIEVEALEMERAGRLDSAHLLPLRRRLTELKSEALEKHAEGVLKGEEQMISFLTHVSDVRSYLESLFAHESRLHGRAAEPTIGSSDPPSVM